MTDKKVVVRKVKKIRWIRKKALYTLVLMEFQDIWKAIQKLNKEINNVKGEIKADLSLKELDNGIWNVIISIDGENQVDLKGHLNLVLDNIQLFKRVYDFEKSIKKDSKKELCKECLYKENSDDNTCGTCKPNSPQSRFTPKASGDVQD